jgi:hypothetical protein
MRLRPAGGARVGVWGGSWLTLARGSAAAGRSNSRGHRRRGGTQPGGTAARRHRRPGAPPPGGTAARGHRRPGAPPPGAPQPGGTAARGDRRRGHWLRGAPTFPWTVRFSGVFRPVRRTIRGKRGREGPV